MTTSFEIKLKNAVDHINYAYNQLGNAIDVNDENAADEYGDMYEHFIEYYARKLKVNEAWLEDCATDTRYIGWDRC